MHSCYGKDKRLREWSVGIRLVLILWTLWVALSVPYLLEFMGLIGNITGTMLSFIWPAYFHLKLREKVLTPEEARVNKMVIGTGFVICVVGVFYSALELYTVIKYDEDV